MEKDPEETGTSVSLTSKSPVAYSSKVVNFHKHSAKCHTYDDELMSEMTNRFNSLVYGMGFEDPVEADTMNALMMWIKDQFSTLSMNEMLYAFQMASAFTLPGAPKHYKNFDMQYIGGVLNAYKTHRNKQLKLLEDEENAKKSAEEVKNVATGEEMYNSMKKLATEQGEIMRIGDWTGAFKYAWKENFIHRMNKKERKAYKKSTKQALESEKRANFLPSTFNIKDSLQSECHKQIMQCHFQEMIDKKPS